MKRNVGNFDRIVRFIVGLIALGGLIIVQAIWLKVILGIVAIVMFLTAVVGFCPLYRLLGFSTCPLEGKK